MSNTDTDAWPEDGIFAQDSFKPSEFSSQKSLFEDQGAVNTRNPTPKNLAEERAYGQAQPGKPTKVMVESTQGSSKGLIAVFDKNGEPMVAKTAKGKDGKVHRTEEFRRPTTDEHNALRTRGQLVAGGLDDNKSINWLKVGGTVAGVAALAGLGYWLWKNKKEDKKK